MSDFEQNPAANGIYAELLAMYNERVDALTDVVIDRAAAVDQNPAYADQREGIEALREIEVAKDFLGQIGSILMRHGATLEESSETNLDEELRTLLEDKED